MGMQEEILEVARLLAVWKTLISTHNAIDLYDINRLSEYWTGKLLNLVFDLKLKNLNPGRKNFPAIDLGDEENKIAFQVTSRKDVKKIKDTLKKFVAGNFTTVYTNLRFLILNHHKPRLSQDKYAKIFQGFNVNNDILNYDDLVSKIRRLFDSDRKKFSRIKNFLEEEFGRGGKIEVNEILREGAKNYYNNLRGPNGRFRFLRISDIILPGSHDRWLETNVEVNQSNEISTILNVLPGLWKREIKHAVIVGPGGMGKTVSLLHWWEKLLEKGETVRSIPVFIALNELNQVPEGKREDFIVSRVWRHYAKKSTAKEQVEKAMITPLGEGEHFVPSMVLLLDGFNEITVEKKEFLLEIKYLTEQCPGLQVVITSRYDMRGNFNWSHWHLVKLKELEENRVEEYLSKRGINVPQQERLRALIQNPMMLTIYAAACEVQQNHRGSIHCSFKEQVETPGELLWNFMEAQVARLPERLGEDEKEIAYYKFLLKFFLPGLGFAMEKAGLFDFSLQQLHHHIETLCRRFGQDDFFDTFTRFHKFGRALPVGECEDSMARRERTAVLQEIFCRELSLLVEEGDSFRFLHQDFRDFFAAVHILHELEMGMNKGIPVVLQERALDFNVRRLIGELEGEYKNKPYLTGAGWRIGIGKENRLHRVLEGLRGKFGTEVGYAAYNIVEIWKVVRGELSGTDLSRLDLTAVMLNGVRCSRLYNQRYLAASFEGSRVHEQNLFPCGHSSTVTIAVYSPDGKKILSASSDDTIKEWDADTDECVKILASHADAVTSVEYNADGKKILSASVDKTIKEWDEASGQCLKILTGHSDWVKSAVYSPDGKKILSASWDNTIKEWDAGTGECVKTLAGHSSGFNNAVYSPDGKQIFSTSEDETIRVWDTDTGQCMEAWDKSDASILKYFLNKNLNESNPTDWNKIITPTITIVNIPGLWIQGCSFKDLEKGSRISPENLELLKQYGGRF